MFDLTDPTDAAAGISRSFSPAHDHGTPGKRHREARAIPPIGREGATARRVAWDTIRGQTAPQGCSYTRAVTLAVEPPTVEQAHDCCDGPGRSMIEVRTNVLDLASGFSLSLVRTAPRQGVVKRVWQGFTPTAGWCG